MKAPQRRYELSDDEWKCIASYFPVRKAGIKGRPYNDVRTTVNGIYGLPAVVLPGETFPNVTANGTRYTNALQNGRSRAFSKRCSMNSE